ncbi:MAG: RtcB family protein [Trueperaceae bacterium]|nr:RtcB family protein [Trueperaceae bacterium]
MMNTHVLLIDYHDHPNYPKIAKAVSKWVKQHPGASEAEVLAYVSETFNPRSFLRPNAKAAPLAIFGTIGEHIPQGAEGQIYDALKLPVAKRGALMPDAHVGYALPIGGVVSLERAVSPSFVGYDISCMVQLSLLDLSVAEFEKHRESLAKHLYAETSFGLGADFASGKREHDIEFDPRWGETRDLKNLHEKAMIQLGSSGGGNHFADLLTVEFVEDFGDYKAGETAVCLMTHSGSRGTGHKLATLFVKRAETYTKHVARGIPKGYEWLSLEEDAGKEYWLSMELMGDYAKANHDLIHEHFASAAGLQIKETVWNRHNYAWLEGDEVIHRKGATPAEVGRLGIIPGTSGTASYLVRGLGNEASLHSSSHGAGRWVSRTQAKKDHDEGAFQRHMKTSDILHFGLSPDETYQAYKDIEMVMDLQEDVLIKRIAKLTPRVVIMGGQADDGD